MQWPDATWNANKQTFILTDWTRRRQSNVNSKNGWVIRHGDGHDFSLSSFQSLYLVLLNKSCSAWKQFLNFIHPDHDHVWFRSEGWHEEKGSMDGRNKWPMKNTRQKNPLAHHICPVPVWFWTMWVKRVWTVGWWQFLIRNDHAQDVVQLLPSVQSL